MEVILLKDVEKLGFTNDIVNVAPGYANNYLIPNGFARHASVSAKKILSENLKQQEHKEAKFIADAEAMVKKIEALALSITAKAEEGKIFGSVTSADIAEAMKAKGVEVDRKNITVDAVKTVGEFEAVVRVYKNIKGTVKFSVKAEE